VRGWTSPWRGAARGRSAGDSGPVLHPPAGEGRGVRTRQGRQGPSRAHGGAVAGDEPASGRRALGRRAGGRDLRPQPGTALTRCRTGDAFDGRVRMIALLSGTVAVRRADHVGVECGGGGYRAAVSAETLRHVPAVGREVVLHTH